MQRLTLLATGALMAAVAVILIRPMKTAPGDSSSPAENGARSSSARDVSENDSRSGKHRSSSAKDDSFRQRTAEIAAMPPDIGRENAVRELAQQWAVSSLAAAEEWAAALEDPAERERALTHVCLAIADRHPREAIVIAQRHEVQGGMIDSLAGQWAAQDFEAASAWAGGLPQGELRERVTLRLVQSRASEAPAEAAGMLSSLSGAAQEEAATTVVYQWLLKDPEAARQWVAQFREGALKDRATSEIEGALSHSGTPE